MAELTALYGVQTAYRDSRGRWRESPLDSVVKVLRALGAELGDGGMAGDECPGDRPLTAAIRARKRELGGRLLKPVLVAWDGVLPPNALRHLVVGRRDPKLTLILEGGEEEQWAVGSNALGLGSIRGKSRLLPLGYHRLRVEVGGSVAETTVISAPRRCWAPEQALARTWGVFTPLYALRSERNWGAGDLADLGTLRDWVADGGGSAVATLPLLAGYLDCPFEPAPYRPVSRLFWNEFYLAVDQIAEWQRCAGARELWDSADLQDRLALLRAEPAVDYRDVMALKRRVLEELSRCFFTGQDAGRKEAFSAYVRSHPHAEEYAAFRASVEAAPEARQYHLYCQWQMEEQLGRLSGRGTPGAPGTPASAGAGPSGPEPELGRLLPGPGRPLPVPAPGLFLDLPLGVHPGGFDTWRWPELFAAGMSTGAPPDAFFALGQNWDSPPLHPERIREQGHRYFASCVRHHMRHARYLRIDHVMSLHRLFWVPEGTEPTDGVYVTYPADELYAVLCLESHRNETVVVGEDLGTVPAGVRSSLRRRGVLGTWVFQGSLRSRAAAPVGPVPRHTVASVNTHDMFPLAGFVRGDDVAARVQTGQLDREQARREMAARRHLVARLAEVLPPSAEWVGMPSFTEPAGTPPPGSELLFRALAYLAGSQATLVLVSLEDLLLETRPQNLPGTGAEWGNWRRKATGSEADAARAIVAVAAWFATVGTTTEEL